MLKGFTLVTDGLTRPTSFSSPQESVYLSALVGEDMVDKRGATLGSIPEWPSGDGGGVRWVRD